MDTSEVVLADRTVVRVSSTTPVAYGLRDGRTMHWNCLRDYGNAYFAEHHQRPAIPEFIYYKAKRGAKCDYCGEPIA